MNSRGWTDVFCALVTITAVSIVLIGYGESRSARHCAAMVQAVGDAP